MQNEAFVKVMMNKVYLWYLRTSACTLKCEMVGSTNSLPGTKLKSTIKPWLMMIKKESHQSHFVVSATRNYTRLHGFVKGEVRDYLMASVCKENVRASFFSLHFVPLISASPSLSRPIIQSVQEAVGDTEELPCCHSKAYKTLIELTLARRIYTATTLTDWDILFEGDFLMPMYWHLLLEGWFEILSNHNPLQFSHHLSLGNVTPWDKSISF